MRVGSGARQSKEMRRHPLPPSAFKPVLRLRLRLRLLLLLLWATLIPGGQGAAVSSRRDTSQESLLSGSPDHGDVARDLAIYNAVRNAGNLQEVPQRQPGYNQYSSEITDDTDYKRKGYRRPYTHEKNRSVSNNADIHAVYISPHFDYLSDTQNSRDGDDEEEISSDDESYPAVPSSELWSLDDSKNEQTRGLFGDVSFGSNSNVSPEFSKLLYEPPNRKLRNSDQFQTNSRDYYPQVQRPWQSTTKEIKQKYHSIPHMAPLAPMMDMGDLNEASLKPKRCWNQECRTTHSRSYARQHYDKTLYVEKIYDDPYEEAAEKFKTSIHNSLPGSQMQEISGPNIIKPIKDKENMTFLLDDMPKSDDNEQVSLTQSEPFARNVDKSPFHSIQINAYKNQIEFLKNQMHDCRQRFYALQHKYIKEQLKPKLRSASERMSSSAADEMDQDTPISMSNSKDTTRNSATDEQDQENLNKPDHLPPHHNPVPYQSITASKVIPASTKQDTPQITGTDSGREQNSPKTSEERPWVNTGDHISSRESNHINSLDSQGSNRNSNINDPVTLNKQQSNSLHSTDEEIFKKLMNNEESHPTLLKIDENPIKDVKESAILGQENNSPEFIKETNNSQNEALNPSGVAVLLRSQTHTLPENENGLWVGRNSERLQPVDIQEVYSNIHQPYEFLAGQWVQIKPVENLDTVKTEPEEIKVPEVKTKPEINVEPIETESEELKTPNENTSSINLPTTSEDEIRSSNTSQNTQQISWPSSADTTSQNASLILPQMGGKIQNKLFSKELSNLFQEDSQTWNNQTGSPLATTKTLHQLAESTSQENNRIPEAVNTPLIHRGDGDNQQEPVLSYLLPAHQQMSPEEETDKSSTTDKTTQDDFSQSSITTMEASTITTQSPLRKDTQSRISYLLAQLQSSHEEASNMLREMAHQQKHKNGTSQLARSSSTNDSGTINGSEMEDIRGLGMKIRANEDEDASNSTTPEPSLISATEVTQEDALNENIQFTTNPNLTRHQYPSSQQIAGQEDADVTSTDIPDSRSSEYSLEGRAHDFSEEKSVDQRNLVPFDTISSTSKPSTGSLDDIQSLSPTTDQYPEFEVETQPETKPEAGEFHNTDHEQQRSGSGQELLQRISVSTQTPKTDDPECQDGRWRSTVPYSYAYAHSNYQYSPQLYDYYTNYWYSPYTQYIDSTTSSEGPRRTRSTATDSTHPFSKSLSFQTFEPVSNVTDFSTETSQKHGGQQDTKLHLQEAEKQITKSDETVVSMSHPLIWFQNPPWRLPVYDEYQDTSDSYSDSSKSSLRTYYGGFTPLLRTTSEPPLKFKLSSQETVGEDRESEENMSHNSSFITDFHDASPLPQLNSLEQNHSPDRKENSLKSLYRSYSKRHMNYTSTVNISHTYTHNTSSHGEHICETIYHKYLTEVVHWCQKEMERKRWKNCTSNCAPTERSPCSKCMKQLIQNQYGGLDSLREKFRAYIDKHFPPKSPDSSSSQDVHPCESYANAKLNILSEIISMLKDVFISSRF